jgi:Kef-type K+ transport system membrane component KefB
MCQKEAVTKAAPDKAAKVEKKDKAPKCPAKLIIFTCNLLIGLFLSQLMPTWLSDETFSWYKHGVKLTTMFCLSYIMISVGYEFDIDKSRMGSYGKDYAIAMTAAGFPWIFVAAWFIYVLPAPLAWDEALIAARFAAPTSAGILFSMLEAMGMKETWLFKKARVLAIFDDLDTILLMVPLKVLIVGMKWELSIDLSFVVVLCALIWIFLHKLKIPVSWWATMGYGLIVTIICEFVHWSTHSETTDPHDLVDTVHLEVLLPAFAIGCVARCGHATNAHVPKHVPKELKRQDSFKAKVARRSSYVLEQLQREESELVNTLVSTVFMIFVGLSMPELFGDPSAAAHHRMLGGGHAHHGSHGSSAHGSVDGKSYGTRNLTAQELCLHVAAVSVLMVIGKMFPVFCYRDEATLGTRTALSLGMCPRGEVGAGVIVVSLGFGIKGAAITVAVLSLAINLVCSGFFIMAVKKLSTETPGEPYSEPQSPITPATTAGGSKLLDKGFTRSDSCASCASVDSSSGLTSTRPKATPATNAVVPAEDFVAVPIRG